MASLTSVFHGRIMVDSISETPFGIRRFPGIDNRAFHGSPSVGDAFVADGAGGHLRQDHLCLEAGLVGAVIDSQVVDGVSPDKYVRSVCKLVAMAV